MFARYRYALPTLFIMLGSISMLHAQNAPRPEELTNRPLAYPSDPSAVGWNPSLLGVKTGTYGLLVALPYNSSFSLPGSPYGLFGKFGPIGVGVLNSTNDSARPFTQFYAGIGWPAIKDRFWVGGGLRVIDNNGAILSGGLIVSSTIRPSSKVIASLALINPTSTNNENASLSLYGAYSLYDWLTLLANAHYDESDTLSGSALFKLSLGVNVQATKQLSFSGQYKIGSGTLRIGAEIGFAGVGAGITTAFNGGFQGGVAFARYATREEEMSSYEAPPDVLPPLAGTTNRLGWAPSRAYVPAGLEYKKQTTDAQVSANSYIVPCDSVNSMLTTAPDLIATAAKVDGPYTALARTLNTLSPDPAHLYGAIRAQYYSPRIHYVAAFGGQNNMSHRIDSLPLVSRQGYSIGIQSIDYGEYPRVSVIMQVANEVGRNVAGLGSDDFSLRDTSLKIVSVKPIDRKLTVPVDIVLLIDCSGSMTQKIAAVRANVEKFVNNIEERGANYRIGGVLYGSIIYDTLHPTANFSTFRDFFANAAAIGGDEISSLAVKAASEMRFRPNAQRVFILITDDYAIQDNSRLTEADLTTLLWKTGARLYTIITPCRNNSAIMTRLSLGGEYDIRKPFNAILDDIGSDITTIYQLVYESNGRDTVATAPVPTAIAGHVTDENGAGVSAEIKVENATTLAQVATMRSDSSGHYTITLPEHGMYRVTATRADYIPTPIEVEAKEGTQLLQDLKITSIDAAIRSGKWFVLKNIFFDFNKWDLKPESLPELSKLVTLLSQYPTINLEIGAHTDAEGTDEYNQTLSEHRAQSVVGFLIDKGIAPSRVHARGYGKSMPMATNDTDEGRALNRRVEFRLVK